ncbi:kinesin-like protein klpA [Penicillium riverlandense]|uniref:kinesin-like protein klpA n=1 Tax=Penicillium riverlandense TaxID=1903569 RepID=UPI00254995A7|nr:kinesin-like protein klpA [Penicillium riverlandense]KAJ5826426.1 kinesin-like protein klpA [Penicillium riverlandense]
MEDENMTHARASARTRIPQAGLREMTSATTNSRSGILPPGSIASKASVSPATRPKTANPTETKRSGSVTRPTNGPPKMHNRGNSFASSTMSRPGSTTARPTNASFSATVGYGARPPSAVSRPHSSLGATRKHAITSSSRPATSLATHGEETGSVLGKRKGMQYFPLFPTRTPYCPSETQEARSRRDYDGHSVTSSVDEAGTLCSDFSRLTTYGAVVDSARSPSPSRPKDCHKPPMPMSRVPVLETPVRPRHNAPSSSPMRSIRTPQPPSFLRKDSSIQTFDHATGAEWDQESRENNMEDLFLKMMTQLNKTGQESFGLKETVDLYKTRISELESSRDGLTETNLTLRVELESLKTQLSTAENALKDARREHEIAVDDLDRRHRIEMESIKQDGKKDSEILSARHQEEIRELKRQFERNIEDEKAARVRELGQLSTQSAMDTQKTQIELEKKDRELTSLEKDIHAMKLDLERERKSTQDLRQNLDIASSNSLTLESSLRALKARIEFLEGGREEQSEAFERCNQQMMDALAETDAIKEKLRKEETMRRKLHNQVQELKGNIRVFCRVRPSVNGEPESDVTPMQFPDQSDDAKEINVLGPEEKSSLGTISRKNNTFSFDRVFGPSTQNGEIFDEISQLVQSALDGYNVCIFCYGQTGSGKTFTMSSLDGMIPRAVHQIYDTAQGLEEKGWRYTMAGNFVEVYNENLNDLLGNPEELDKKKHEIRHDMQRGKTTITDINTVHLDSPEMVESILKQAAANRSVAATKANERSSRSHSVFILKLIGENHITGERSEGTLNLVDLAGSERLSHSGATGDRLKETQNINRSLSSLGDVIAALGQGKDGGHIPYRNSKLTYLLQFSLGGNSKTLMFVMVSPLQDHLSETLTSLKFATKVYNTHIGTAKRQARVRDT